MRKLKDSGIEWIGEIPMDWNLSRIGRYCALKTGSTPPTSQIEYFDGKVNWFTPSDFNGSYLLEDSERKLTDLATNNNVITLFSKHSILLVAIGATVGKIGYINEDSYSNQQITAIIPQNIYYKYLLYYLVVATDYIKNNALYTTLPIINNAYLKDIPLLIPNDVSIQKQISGYLDRKCSEIDSIIKSKETTNEKLKEYRQSIIYEAVTKGLDKNVPMKDSGIDWIGKIPKQSSICKIKDKYEITLGKMLQPNKKYEDDEFCSYLCSVNITWDGVDLSILKQMWFSQKEKPTYRLKDGDLLTVEGGDVAISCLWKNEVEECYVQNAIHIVRPKRGSDNRYLYYWMQILKNIGYIDLICNKATISHFTKDKYMTCPLISYEIVEQKQIADYLDKKCAEIISVIDANEKTIEKLKGYRQSIIYEAVTGKTEIV